MATEYGLQDGDNQAELARELIDRAGPDKVSWSPRPDTPGGGVYVVEDDQAAADVLRARRIRRDEEAQRIEKAQRAADERDRAIDGTGLTPAEAGYSANTGTDPGSAEQARINQEAVEGKHADADPNPAAETKAEAIRAKDAEGEGIQDDPENDPEGEGDETPAEGDTETGKRETPAQRRARAKAERDAEAAKADTAKADTDK